jgi:signal transduction histidine kinase
LLGNALRYTDAGGRIVIRAFEPRQSNNVREVVVEVSDNGQGIAPEDLPYLFDHFYRADKSRSRASGGSGIGLAIVKQLVEAHHGRVWVESKVGKGATFSFALPVPGA